MYHFIICYEEKCVKPKGILAPRLDKLLHFPTFWNEVSQVKRYR